MTKKSRPLLEILEIFSGGGAVSRDTRGGTPDPIRDKMSTVALRVTTCKDKGASVRGASLRTRVNPARSPNRPYWTPPSFYGRKLVALRAGDDEAGFKKAKDDEIARKNLERYSPDLRIQLIESRDGGRAAILNEYDGYDAARLLLGRLHERLAPELDGDFLVATPARDMFVAMTADPPEFVDRLRERAAQDYRRLPYPITRDLFVVTRDGVAGTAA